MRTISTILTLAIASAVSIHSAFAQDISHEVRAHDVFTTAPASPISTTSFYPQVSLRSIWKPVRPENPSPPFYRFEAQPPPNFLPVGRINPVERGSIEARFPAVEFNESDPPDPHMAAGPNHLVVVVNSDIAYFDKATGEKQFQQTSVDFFTGIGAGDFHFDPKVFFDRSSQRFFIIFLEGDDVALTSKILMAVSDDNNPAGTWFRYRIEAKAVLGTGDEAAPSWLDYPGMGINKDGIVLTGNMFTFDTFDPRGHQILAIRKASALTGGTLTITRFFDTQTMYPTIQPCETASVTEPRIYMVNSENTSQLRVWAVSNLTTTPTLVSALVTVPTYTFAEDTTPIANAKTVDTVAFRLLNASLRNGKIVTAHTVNQPLARVRWYQLSVNSWPVSGAPTLSQSGEIPIGSDATFMPAINQNSVNDIALVFSRANSTIAPDMMMAGRKQSDPVGTVGTPLLMQSSAGNDYGDETQNRWGDYAAVSVDPTDDLSFWGIHMTGRADGKWRTFFFRFQITPPALALSGLSVPASGPGGGTNTGEVFLTANATSPTTVMLSTSSGVANVPASVVVPTGSSSATFPITSPGVNSAVTVTITATRASVTKTDTIQVVPAVPLSLTIPAMIVGGTTSTATLTLNGKAGSSGVVISMSSNSGLVTVPASFAIAAQESSRTVNISTTAVSTNTPVVITASARSVTKTANVTLVPAGAPLSSISISPATIVGGSGNATATITLVSIAPPGGAVVTLTSNNTAAITIPASVTVPAGAATHTFPVVTNGVNANITVTVTAKRNSITKTDTVTVTKAEMINFTLNNNIVTGGSRPVGTVTLNGKAGPSGTLINVIANPNIVIVPSAFNVLPQTSSRQFAIGTNTTSSTRNVTIFVTQGSLARSQSLQILPPGVLAITATPTALKGGANVTVTVKLKGNAPSGGTTVNLSSSKPTVAPVPATLVFAAGEKQKSFVIHTNTVMSQQSVTIAAVANSTSRTVALTVNP